MPEAKTPQTKAGLTIRPGLIYEVRRAAKVRKRTAKKTASMVAKKATKPVESKAAFVRANRSVSPQEIVAKTKTEGVKLNVGYVYNVRGADRAARKKKRAVAKAVTSTPATMNGAKPAVNSTRKLCSRRSALSWVCRGRWRFSRGSGRE